MCTASEYFSVYIFGLVTSFFFTAINYIFKCLIGNFEINDQHSSVVRSQCDPKFQLNRSNFPCRRAFSVMNMIFLKDIKLILIGIARLLFA